MSLKNKIRGLKEVWRFENRLWLILTRMFFPGEKIQIYQYKGMDILIDHSAGDANGAREVLTSMMYQRFFPQMNLKNGINVLDLGANNGGFPLLLQANGFTLKKVVSVELNPKTYTRLRFNLERNLLCPVVTLNAAVCGNPGLLRISLSEGSVADSIYDNDETKSESKIYEIQGLTLDEIWSLYYEGETVDICKIDVEEAEFDIFQFPNHLKLSQCRYLIMEIHERDGRRAGEILPAVESLGFVRQINADDADPAVHFFINTKLK